MCNEVYRATMSRTNIDIDDELMERAMAMYRLNTKREAIQFALQQLVGAELSVEEALALEGSGFESDLGALRDDNTPPGPTR